MYSYVGKGGSVHRAHWPEAKSEPIDVEAEKDGDLIADIVRAVRRYKSEEGIPLNAPLAQLEIYADELDTEDIENAMATKVNLCTRIDELKSDGALLDIRGTKVRISKG
jgi:valyl-tRNA synthetase